MVIHFVINIETTNNKNHGEMRCEEKDDIKLLSFFDGAVRNPLFTGLATNAALSNALLESRFFLLTKTGNMTA